MRPLPVTPFAGSPPFVRGLSMIRGGPIPVVDLGALLGGPDPEKATRFVTLRLDGRFVALAVGSVLGVQDLTGTMSSLPPLLADASAEAVSTLGVLDAELFFVLEAARLVPDSVWQSLEGRGSG